MLPFVRTIAIVLLLSSTAASGSYWVGDFNGPALGYKIIRDSEPIPIEQLMLLEPGDIVVIDKPGGQSDISGQRGDTVFVVEGYVHRRGSIDIRPLPRRIKV